MKSLTLPGSSATATSRRSFMKGNSRRGGRCNPRGPFTLHGVRVKSLGPKIDQIY